MSEKFDALLASIELSVNGPETNLAINLTAADLDADEDDPVDCFKWNLYNSVFFSFTAVTTIGRWEITFSSIQT